MPLYQHINPLLLGFSFFICNFAGITGHFAIDKLNCMSEIEQTKLTTAPKVGGAVGVPDRHWYIAIVGTNTEKSCREKLDSLGYECYVATQNEIHEWRNGQRKMVETVVITRHVFIRLTEQERRTVVNLPFIKSFMVNKAAAPSHFGIRPVAIVPDKQMKMLQYMLFKASEPIEFVGTPLALGDTVRIMRGTMKGFEGQIVQMKDSEEKFIGVNVGFLGCAILRIPAEDIQKI